MPPYSFFFFNGPATTEIYPLSLHDALPISPSETARPAQSVGGLTPGATRRLPLVTIHSKRGRAAGAVGDKREAPGRTWRDRKSTRLNSSHGYISYAVFCLKKNTKPDTHDHH